MIGNTVNLQELFDELYEDCDNAIADDVYKGLKHLQDENGDIDLTDAEAQLFIRDFLELHSNDYQIDIFKPILLQYYDPQYDIIEEVDESKQTFSKKLEDLDDEYDDEYENTYGAIIDRMELASSYEELYEIADEINDATLAIEVKNAIEQCEEDGDDVEEAYSIVTSDLLDMRRFDLNESKEIKVEKKSSLNVEELAQEYFSIAQDIYGLEWNSANAEQKKQLAKQAVSAFVEKYPEVKKVIKEFAAILDDENYHTDREAFNDLFKFESDKMTEAVSENKFEASINGINKNLKSQDELDCFNAIINTLHGLTNKISNFDINLKDQTQNFVIFSTSENGDTFVMEFDTNTFGKPTKLYTAQEFAIINKEFIDLATLLNEML